MACYLANAGPAIFAIVFSAMTASAQSVELGGLIGGGVFSVSSGGSTAAGQAGVEVCAFCPGRLALFGEYGHWFSAERSQGVFYSDRVRNADLAGGGLRIQWRTGARIFLDVGLVVGRDKHAGLRGGALGGVVVGSGVRVPLGERWYIRPQVRMYGLSPHSIEGVDAHWAVSAGVGIGWRL